MAQNRFDMKTQRKGWLKYILLTILPSISIIVLCLILTEIGIIPVNETFSNLVIYGAMAVMTFLSYALVTNKNHAIEVRGSTVTEKNMYGKEIRKFSAKQVASVRRNMLDEIILLDGNGKKLLCVESNMSDCENFLQWMDSHNIENK